ncbi:unnamed protein product [Fusarium graminearum]|nr:unnamed protein product [Fusarium graminearum]
MPRKPRMKKNRNPEVGMKNRQLGMSKMANTWHQYYGGQALVLIRKQDGGLAGFQSDPGLLQNLSRLELHRVSLLEPYHFIEKPKFVSPTDGFCPCDKDTPSFGSKSGTPEILQPKPMSGQQLLQKKALVDLLESAFN